MAEISSSSSSSPPSAAASSAAAAEKYNKKNPAIKRILQEVKEMQSNPSDDFMSLPLEEDIFEWQFAILGPRDTEFEGGIYHGRIQLPGDYPFKPPSFMMLTPNGRFETQTKICLSISNHHPEHWQPSWSVRTALVALIAFMPTNPDGALGSLDYKKEERRALAAKSRDAAPKFGTPERQKVIDEIHKYMLGKVPPVPSVLIADQLDGASDGLVQMNQGGDAVAVPELVLDQEPGGRVVEDLGEVRLNAEAGRVRLRLSAGVRLSRRAPPAAEELPQGLTETTVRNPANNDRIFTVAAIGLTLAIVVLLLKKFMKSHG